MTGNFEHENWHISPSVGIIYFEETQFAYTDTNGYDIGEQTNSLGTINFGPMINYTFNTKNGMVIRVLAGIKGVWDFESPDMFDVNWEAVGTEGLRARAKTGLYMRNERGFAMQATYTYDGIGVDDWESHTGELIFNLPLPLPAMKGANIQLSYSVAGMNVWDGVNDQTDSNEYAVKCMFSVPLP